MTTIHIIPLLLALTLIASQSGARTVYVNKNAVGDVHDGASWATAFLTVQAGVDAAVSGDEVWVAASTPAAPAYVENVTAKSGAALYGGFAGTETERGQRDWRTEVTVLDGNQAGSVVTVPSTATTAATVDGFTIRNGKADDGGGIYVGGGLATIANNIISGNSASDSGGGIYVIGTATITDNTISENNAGRGGGGVRVERTARITNTGVTGNSAGLAGGGIQVYGSATVVNSTLIGNCSGHQGGGMDVWGRVAVSNTTLAGNTADFGGGGICVGFTGTTTMTNAIVAFNSSGLWGSGRTTLSHNNVFGNTAYDYGGVTDPVGANGNISADPLFVGRDGGDFHLRTGSLCIDAGDDSVVSTGQTDLDGNPRILGGHVDMGAYESPGTTGYRWWDAARATRIAGGIVAASTDDLVRLNVTGAGTAIDLADAARIARKAAGKEPNP